MRAHIIENGIVINTIEVESLDFMPNLLDAEIGGQIGDTWDGENFTPKAPVVEVPKEVTMRQAELALLAAGLLDDVEDFIATLTREAQITWKRSSVVQRSNPLIAVVANANGMTTAQIDQLFITAAGL